MQPRKITLKKIKLAGFKSFVDPTTILLPSDLIGVVGPNGCGKSNIIDGVCWVMGENSAKQLRGENSQDVIFNGSTTRKPIGQASVELIFDNQEGGLGGEYGSYAEISIKRILTRDGDSSYYLNGARCRRRDIIDIFLGTGLGPRSYSIIGQNMVSRIIEAKPDDMRIYLEEAAGISKYKDRRRETENRIQHTKENLARLNDIRTELDKQLGNLKRQANAAEKYKSLKQEERLLRAQHYAIQWKQWDSRLVEYTLHIKQQETGLESLQTEMTSMDLDLEHKRNDLRLASEHFQTIQQKYFIIGNEITKAEEEIRYTEERKIQIQQDTMQLQNDCLHLTDELTEASEKLLVVKDELTTLIPELEAANKKQQAAAQNYETAEQNLQDWQSQSDVFNQKASEAAQIAQVEQTRIQHLEQQLAGIQQQQQKFQHEEQHVNSDSLEQEVEAIDDQLNDINAEYQDKTKTIQSLQNQIQNIELDYQENTEKLDEIRNQLQRMRGEQSSLEALQQAALGQRDRVVMDWLAKNKLDKNLRLAQSLAVEVGWEHAIEKVLSNHLQAVCVDNLTQIAELSEEIKEGNLIFYHSHTTADSHSNSHEKKSATLTSKLKSKVAINGLLDGIYAVDTLKEALDLCGSLSQSESVITKDGIWLSPSWLRIIREKDPRAGIFQREQELKHLAEGIQQQEQIENELEEKILSQKEQIKELESRQDDEQDAANNLTGNIAQLTAQLKMKKEQSAAMKKRAEQLNQEQANSSMQYEKVQNDLKASKANWQKALSDLELFNQQKNEMAIQRDQLKDLLKTYREQANLTKEHTYQLELKRQSAQSQQVSLQQQIDRLQHQLTELEKRKSNISSEDILVQSINELKDKLSAILNQRLNIEEELRTARFNMESLDQDIKSIELKRQEIEKEMLKFRDQLESLRIEWQSFKVKSENVLEQLKAIGLELESILKEIPEEAAADEWQLRVEQINQRITRLGAINLVAIEEFSACSERKEYLDKQNEDLQQGLATLEDAISKIDRETRARLQETFDKVNTRFKELFPKIFGGGHAALELTSDNLLEAGIAVMACPPGKRNSTIHLLSGGEKAMTAIALVFSIFHLNPAPFCLLDEVDAPLDDANIGRFCDLVKSMSEKTQFIFISHNKLAIEMAEHLIGVTMHEPGVSRLVSVNVEEAIELATA